jgi:hypothetical protein
MFEITLSPDQVNLIYATLSERPHKEVAQTIASLTGQVQAQEAARARAAQEKEAAARADADELARLRAENASPIVELSMSDDGGRTWSTTQEGPVPDPQAPAP